MMKLTQLSIAAALAAGLVSGTTAACENHAGPMFGAFSHPAMQSYKRHSVPKKLILTHDREASAQVNQPEVIDISYHLPLNFRDVKLTFVTSDDIELEQEGTVSINRVNGKYALNYTAKTPGEHKITIKAQALRNGAPYSHNQQINLTVQ